MELTDPLVRVGILQAILYLIFIRGIDLYEREPLRYVVTVFVWGCTVAVAVSGAFNSIFAYAVSRVASREVTDFLTAVVSAPLIEETSKGLGLLLIYFVAYLARRRSGVVEFAGVMDGIVYGSAVAFGFSIAEDVLYGTQYGAETFVARRIFGGFAHASFTSMTGIGIGLIPFVDNKFFKPIPPLLGLLGAILLHSGFNFTATLFGGLAYIVLFLVILFYILIIVASLAFERRAIQNELRDEIGRTITPEEYTILPTYFKRTQYYLNLIFSGHLRTWTQARKLHAAAVDLALAKLLARRYPSPKRQERVLRLRQKISNLRADMSPQTIP